MNALVHDTDINNLQITLTSNPLVTVISRHDAAKLNGGVHVIQAYYSGRPYENARVLRAAARSGHIGSYEVIVNEADDIAIELRGKLHSSHTRENLEMLRSVVEKAYAPMRGLWKYDAQYYCRVESSPVSDQEERVQQNL